MTAAEDVFGRNEDMIFVSHYDSPLGILYLAADKDGLKGVWFEGQKYFAHTLNNTVVAPPRMLIAFLENNLNEDGSVSIPKALQPYMGGMTKIEKKHA